MRRRAPLRAAPAPSPGNWRIWPRRGGMGARYSACRPPGDIARVFAAKPVAIIGASPGGFGTVLAQNAWWPILRALGADLWTGGRLLVPHAAKVIGADGRIVDGAVEDALRRFLDSFVGYARRRSPPAKSA